MSTTELKTRLSPVKVDKWYSFFRLAMPDSQGMFKVGNRRLIAEFSQAENEFMLRDLRWFPDDYLHLTPLRHWRYTDMDGLAIGWTRRFRAKSVQVSPIAWKLRQEVGDQAMHDLQIPYTPIGEYFDGE